MRTLRGDGMPPRPSHPGQMLEPAGRRPHARHRAAGWAVACRHPPVAIQEGAAALTSPLQRAAQPTVMRAPRRPPRPGRACRPGRRQHPSHRRPAPAQKQVWMHVNGACSVAAKAARLPSTQPYIPPQAGAAAGHTSPEIWWSGSRQEINVCLLTVHRPKGLLSAQGTKAPKSIHVGQGNHVP